MLLVDAATAEHASGGIRTVTHGFLAGAATRPWRHELLVVGGPDLEAVGRLEVRRLAALRWRAGRLAYQRLGLPLHAGRLAGRRIEGTLSLDATVPLWPHAGMPAACFVHDLLGLTHPQLWSRAQWLARRAAFATLRRVRPRVLTSSAHNGEEIRRVLGLEARVCRFGCGQLTDAEADAARGREPVPRGDAIVYVGALEARKDVGTLLAAFERAAARLDSTRLVLAGRATPEVARALARWRGRAGVADRVEWRGAPGREATLALIEQARVLVYPSRAEGFGLPVLEALALGTPVVASALPAIRSWAEDGCTYFTPGDVEALAEALEAAVAGAHPPAARGQALAADYRWARFADAAVADWL